MDFSEAVLPKEGELEALPLLLVDCTVEPQLSIGKRGLPAEFEVGQIVRCIGRNGATPVDAARPEAA